MASQFDTWLRELARSGKGGVTVKAIDRGLVYTLAIEIPLDVTADTFAASIRASPDATGSALATFAVSVGAYTGGNTIVTLTLTAVQTAALPADSDLDGVEEFVFDVLRTSSGTQRRFLAGSIPIAGKVT